MKFSFLLKGFLAFLGAVFACLLTGELAVRFVRPFHIYPSEFFRHHHERIDQVLGWAGVPGAWDWFCAREFCVEVRNNEWGFRDDSYVDKVAIAEETQKKRLLVLGDSFAWGWGVEKDERVSEVLESRLGNVVSFNAALYGFDTGQQYLVYEDLKKIVEPDIVILFIYKNDLEELSRSVAYDKNKPRYWLKFSQLTLQRAYNRPPPRTLLERSRAWVPDELSVTPPPLDGPPGFFSLGLHASHFYNWLIFRVHQLQTKGGVPEWPKIEESTYTTMGALLFSFQETVTDSSALFLPVIIPTTEDSLDLRDDNEDVGGKAWNLKVLDQCKRYKIPCLDLSPHFKGRSREVFREDPHWTKKGHSLAASVIERWLEDGIFVESEEMGPSEVVDE